MPLDPQLQVMLEQSAARAAAASAAGPVPPELLRAAGVPVSYLDGTGLSRGFLYYPRVARACAAAREAFTAAIRAAVAASTPDRTVRGTPDSTPDSAVRGTQEGKQHVG
jgi:hypothetical protein